jgi:hypothetical protein
MLDALDSILKVKSLIDGAVTFKLLRARNLPLIVTFLHQEFKKNDKITIPYDYLVQKLGDFLEEIEYAEEDEETKTTKLILDFDEKAKLYLDRWIETGYLRNVMDETSKIPLVIVSKHVEKVFQVFDLLKEKEFVGAESKFKDIFHKLRDIIENANPDKEQRLAELEKRKQAIEEEIRSIAIAGYVTTYEDYQIKSRYEDVSRLASELIGDFKEVEDNFKEITRKIYERQQQEDLSKGKILAETFDALYELKGTDQGKSFYAFWQFMLDDASQQDFKKLTTEVYEVLEDRNIAYPSRALRKLKSLLHLAARKVLDKNGILADKLSREIVSKNQLESRKTRELMAGIRHLAIRNVSHVFAREAYMEIEESPDLYFPMERKLGERQEQEVFSITAETAVLDLDDLKDFSRIFSADLIDKQLLLNHIRQMLAQKPQVSLKEVVDEKGITKGLSELMAYITLVDRSNKFFINAAIRETICFDPVDQKYLELPQIIFSN